MKQKRWMVLVSIILGGIMVFGATLASANSTSGYELYKSALKNTQAADSMTVTGEVLVSDNGNDIIKANADAKMNCANETMSGVLNTSAGGKDNSLKVYRQDDQAIMKDNSKTAYQVFNHPGKPEQKDRKTDRLEIRQKYAADMENLFDAMIGNLSNMVLMDEQADGTKVISVQLSGNQIPPFANALASLAVKSATQHNLTQERGLANINSQLISSLPQLVDEVSISSLNLQAVIDDKDLIKTQKATIAISGKDAGGNPHSIIVNVDMNLTDINNTTPDKVDLTGQEVETLQPGHRGNLED